MSREQSVTVDLGERAYDVTIGSNLIAKTGEKIAILAPGRRTAVITDENVNRCHGDALQASLAAAGVSTNRIVLPVGEQTKCFSALEGLLDQLLDLRLERHDLLIALGGGVIGDLVGFAAAILRRGLRFVQVPTSLLAQVDSSVGGKTGVNARQGKNLIGAFHQPSLVLVDIDALQTLSERELKAGYAEVMKYGLLGDIAFFQWLENNGQAVLARDADAVGHAVRTSVHMKAQIVARDETERGERALLNLGHTFGHALEAATGYSNRLLHGEAVSIGIGLAFEYSARSGFCPQEAPARIAAHCDKLGLMRSVAAIPGDLPDADTFIDLMAQDKKVSAGCLSFILARDIGETFRTQDADPEIARQVWRDALRR